MIRGAFKRAALQLEEGGKPLSTLMRESLEQDFLGTLRALSGFVPKELEATIERKRKADDLTDAELQAIAAGSSSDIAEPESSSDQLH